ncbi:MAG: caspase family protein, partial [Nitrospirae bacterium]|nr:caspase family protein [Nitrospirota bacterium]
MTQRWIISVILLGLMLWTSTGWSVAHAQGQRDIGVAPTVAPASVPITGEYWALIIGIDDYQQAPNLESAVKDATAVRDVLKNRYGFQQHRIIELFNQQATGSAIQNALYQLGRQAGTDDSVFIYYAGHGQYDDSGRLGWWVPTEADPKNPGTFIMDVAILNYIKGMQAKHVYLVADSCFSGTLFGTRALPPIDDQWFAKLYAKSSRWGLTSGANEPVADYGKGGHSVFAYYLLSLLKENTDPYLVPSRIHDRIASLVSNNSRQTPRSEPLKQAGDEGGQFVFRLASTETPNDVPDYLGSERQRLAEERSRFEAEREAFRKQQ